jgi:hypothetical protein
VVSRAPASPPAATASAERLRLAGRRRLSRALSRTFGRAGLVSHLCGKSTPVVDEVHRAAVYFQPDEGFAKDAALNERTLCSGMRLGVAQAALQAENLAQSIDIATCQR